MISIRGAAVFEHPFAFILFLYKSNKNPREQIFLSKS